MFFRWIVYANMWLVAGLIIEADMGMGFVSVLVFPLIYGALGFISGALKV